MFCDVTKQNGYASVGTLYGEILGEIVLPYDSIYKLQKVKMWHIVHAAFVS